MTRKNMSLSAEEYFHLWESLAATVDDPSFPLKLGQAISTESFSPPIFAALCSPNLNVAMERLSHYKKLIGPMTLQVEKDPQRITISLDCLFTENPLPDSLVATELVFLVHLARLAIRDRITPLSVSAVAELENIEDYAQQHL